MQYLLDSRNHKTDNLFTIIDCINYNYSNDYSNEIFEMNN